MTKDFHVPDHINPAAPFLGLLGDTAQARVMHHLLSVDDSFTVSELARATDLSRLSTRTALRSLLGWGAVEVRADGGGWKRYRADWRSPIVLSLDLLVGALNDAQEPGKGIFRQYAEGIAGVRIRPARGRRRGTARPHGKSWGLAARVAKRRRP